MIPTTTNSINCPHCGKVIPLQEAMEKQMELELADKLQGEKERIRLEAEAETERVRVELEKKQAEELERVQRENKEREERAATESEQRIREMEQRELKSQSEAKRIKEESEAAMLQKTRELETKEAQLKADAEKLQRENESKLSEARTRVEEETKKRIQDENTLKDAQTAIQMESLRREAETYRRKLESTSQQLIGEGQEVALEDALRMAFPMDLIEPVQKGMKGADCIQKIKSNGDIIGIMVWESKRTKQWLNEWPGKLKDDMRALNATLAILVTQTPPSDMKIKAGLYDGVWVTDFPTAIPMASALRAGIISTIAVKTLSTNSDGKSQQLLEYVISPEFRGNMQAIIETFVAFQADLAAEKRAAEKQWKKRETTITRALTATNRIYGSLQGMLGEKSMPEIETEAPKQLEG